MLAVEFVIPDSFLNSDTYGDDGSLMVICYNWKGRIQCL